VAFIPTAADVYTNKYFVEDDRNKLAELGFKIFDVNITDKTQKDLQKLLKTADIIFVAGGNTFYLLEKAIESGFDKIVKMHVKKGKYYIGSSAGSVLAGASIEPVKLLDDPSKAPNLKSLDGLKLINKIILPHCGNKKYDEGIKQIIKDYPHLQNKIIKLTDNQALVVNDRTLRIIS
jgi:dipeptidase E